MTKKILVVLITALCCVLIGLSVLFFYLNKSTNKKHSILSFIPPQTELILRINQTSVTTNQFISNQVVNDCFNLAEIKKYWQVIDSITTRNYKTAEVLAKNTSYICIDSLSNYLILVDLDKKTNEHFIDQFLVSSTSSRKIEKFKDGSKAFYPHQDKPLYYFVKKNVFGISSNQDYIKQSIQNGLTEQVNIELTNWETEIRSNISVWGKPGYEGRIINKFTGEYMFGGWLDKLSNSFSFDILWEANKITCKGQLNVDSLNPEIRKFAVATANFNYPFYKADSGQYQNYYFNVLLADSMDNMQPCSFIYSGFTDTSGQQVQLIVSTNMLAVENFKNAIDTSVQIIPMADKHIPEVAVMGKGTYAKILPIILFKNDTSKWFGAVYNHCLFIANSTEALLNNVVAYPGQNFAKVKLEALDLIFSSNQMEFNHLLYSVQYQYQWAKDNQINFTSVIKKK